MGSVDPESITAILGPARAGSSKPEVEACTGSRCHCLAASGSFGTNASQARRVGAFDVLDARNAAERRRRPRLDDDGAELRKRAVGPRARSALDRGDDLVERSLARDPDGEARSVRGRGRDKGGGAGRQEEPSSPGDDPKDGRVARNEPATRCDACPVGAGRQLELHLERTGRIHRRGARRAPARAERAAGRRACARHDGPDDARRLVGVVAGWSRTRGATETCPAA